jgi:hypothetical protein
MNKIEYNIKKRNIMKFIVFSIIILLNIVATKAYPDIEIKHYDKANTPCGNIVNDAIEINNTGGDDLVISQITFRTNDGKISNFDYKFPMTIPAKQNKILIFDFIPKTVGNNSLYIDVESNSRFDPKLSHFIRYNVRIQKIGVIDTIKLTYTPEIPNADVCFEVKNLGDTSASYQIIARDSLLKIITPIITLPYGANKTPCIGLADSYSRTDIYHTNIILKNIKCGFEFVVPVLVKFTTLDTTKPTLICEGTSTAAGSIANVKFKVTGDKELLGYLSAPLSAAITYDANSMELIKKEEIYYDFESIKETEAGKMKTVFLEFPKTIFKKPCTIQFKIGLNAKEIETISLNPKEIYTAPTKYKNYFNASNGVIKVYICKEGGPRQVNINENSGLKKISPNPVGINAQLNYSIVEEGYTSICAYDINGVKVADLYTGTPTQGDYTIDWNTYNLGSGMYIIVMTTPTQTYRQNVAIYK